MFSPYLNHVNHPNHSLRSYLEHRRYLLSLSLLFLAMLLLILLTSPARGEEYSSSDKAFLQEAAENTLYQIEIAKMAAERGTRQDIKESGERVAKDRTKLYEELKALAGNLVDMPEGIGSEYRKRRDIPARRSGEAYDTVYLKEVRKAHAQDIKLYQEQRERTQNAQLKQFLDKTLPLIEMNKAQLEKLEPQNVGNAHSVSP